MVSLKPKEPCFKKKSSKKEVAIVTSERGFAQCPPTFLLPLNGSFLWDLDLIDIKYQNPNTLSSYQETLGKNRVQVRLTNLVEDI